MPPSRPAPPAPAPASQPILPLQYTPFKPSDFSPESSLAFFNQFMSQVTTRLNSIIGAGGPTTLPAGVDVRGATVTNLGAPSSPTDAVPLGHANSSYGPATQRDQLDIGKPYALKGATVAYQQSQANAADIAALNAKFPASTISGGYQTLPGGIILQWGQTPSFDTGPVTITFPHVFPAACLMVIICDNTSSSSRRIWASGGFSTTGFSAQNDGLGVGNWLAVGY